MRIGAGVLAILFILPYLILAFMYPVEGISAYFRFIGLGLFFALIWYSVRKESRGERARPESHETKFAKRMARENRMKAVQEGLLPPEAVNPAENDSSEGTHRPDVSDGR